MRRESPAKIKCKCGELDKEEEELITEKMAEEISRANESSLTNLFLAMSSIDKNCSFCEMKHVKCIKNGTTIAGYECFNNSATLAQIAGAGTSNNDAYTIVNKQSQELPIDIVIPVGGLRARHRQKRSSGSVCGYPTNLDTAELNCTIFPRKIKCVQNCANGYTLPCGISTTRECIFEENQWTPDDFEECLPYVDCGVTLISGGWAVCTTPTVREQVQCRIKCERYEEQPCTGNAIYECDDRRRWTPELPFCVKPGSGLELVKRPTQKNMGL